MQPLSVPAAGSTHWGHLGHTERGGREMAVVSYQHNNEKSWVGREKGRGRDGLGVGDKREKKGRGWGCEWGVG